MKFKIGDVCRLLGCKVHRFRPGCPGYPGIEVTIIGIKAAGEYHINYEGAVPPLRYYARECCLELKKPPAVELGKWEECPWRPSIEVMHEG